MKNVKFILAILVMAGITNVNAQSLKEKLKAKMEKANAKLEGGTKGGSGKGKYKKYDWKDDTGISGTYFTNEQIINRQNTIGFKYTKEKGGSIVHDLYVELGGRGYGDRPNSITCKMKEKYLNKFGFKYFYIVDKDAIHLANNRNVFSFLEIAPNVYAFAEESKVLCVAAKDSTNFADYDTETAQVLFDQNMAKVKADAMEKDNKVWMKNAVYANNIGKVVFAQEDASLMKRGGYSNRPPLVNGKGFTTVLDMGKNMNFMGFFKYPPATMYAGQEINIVYEMNGLKTDRVELRGKSSAWNNRIKRLETKEFEDRQHTPKPLRTYEAALRTYIQDYAFIYLLYQQKDKFMIGKKYNLNVKIYVNRDGENGDLLAEGDVSLLYSMEAHLLYNSNPDKPSQQSVFDHFEEFLDQ